VPCFLGREAVTVFFFYLAAGMIRRIDWSAKNRQKLLPLKNVRPATSLFVTCHFGRQDASIIFWPFFAVCSAQEQADQKGRAISKFPRNILH
jgi:hypothetical protein